MTEDLPLSSWMTGRARQRLPNEWRARAYQIPLWRYLRFGGGKRAIAIWHRRAGKDEVALHWAAFASQQKAAAYWHMLPEYAQGRKAIWNAVNPHTGKRRIDEAFPPRLRRATSEQEMFIRLRSLALLHELVEAIHVSFPEISDG